MSKADKDRKQKRHHANDPPSPEDHFELHEQEEQVASELEPTDGQDADHLDISA